MIKALLLAASILANQPLLSMFEHFVCPRPSPSLGWLYVEHSDVIPEKFRILADPVGEASHHHDVTIIREVTDRKVISLIDCASAGVIFDEVTFFAGENYGHSRQSSCRKDMLQILFKLHPHMLVVRPFDESIVQRDVIGGAFPLVLKIVVPSDFASVPKVAKFAENIPIQHQPGPLLVSHDIVSFRGCVGGPYSSPVCLVGLGQRAPYQANSSDTEDCHDPLCERVARRNQAATGAPTPDPPVVFIALLIAVAVCIALGVSYALHKAIELIVGDTKDCGDEKTDR